MKRLRKQNTVRVFLPTLSSIPGRDPSKRASNCRDNFLPGFRSPAVACFPLYSTPPSLNHGRSLSEEPQSSSPFSHYSIFGLRADSLRGLTSPRSRSRDL